MLQFQALGIVSGSGWCRRPAWSGRVVGVGGRGCDQDQQRDGNAQPPRASRVRAGSRVLRRCRLQPAVSVASLLCQCPTPATTQHSRRRAATTQHSALSQEGRQQLVGRHRGRQFPHQHGRLHLLEPRAPSGESRNSSISRSADQRPHPPDLLALSALLLPPPQAVTVRDDLLPDLG